MTTPPKTFAEPLSYQTVGLGFVGNSFGTRLVIMSASCANENSYAPAESVEVAGIEGVTKLRDLCDRVLNEFALSNPKPA